MGLHRGEEILAAEPEMSSIHSLLSKIPVDLPFEDLLVSCQELYESLPPHIVEEEAKRSREEGKGENERAKGSERRKGWKGTEPFRSNCDIHRASVLGHRCLAVVWSVQWCVI